MRHQSKVEKGNYRVYWEEFDETKIVHKLQRIKRFPVVWDKTSNEMFIFAVKDIAREFAARLNLQKSVELERKTFNLDIVKDKSVLRNVWGVWERFMGGRVKSRGLFGHQVDESSDVNIRNVTALNVEIYHEDERVSLTISRDGCLSSKNILSPTELINIYRTVRDKLTI